MTGNGLFQDSLLSHQVYLQRYAGGLRNKIFEILEKSHGPVKDLILSKLVYIDDFTPKNLERLNKLLDDLKTIRHEPWREVRSLWIDDLDNLAFSHLDFLSASLAASMPVVVDAALPNKELIKSIIKTRPFEGKTLNQWAKKIETDDITRIDARIKIGITQGETPRTIVKDIVREMDISKRHAESVTLTAVNHISTQVNKEFSISNQDIVKEDVILATLDSRTSAQCRARDGDRHKVGEGPYPPFHYRCRTLRKPYFEPDGMLKRPAKPTTERELIAEYNEKNGTSAKNRDDLPRGHKAKFDKYSRKRTRELVGPIPAEVNAEQYWRDRSLIFLEDNMGKTKARLFKDGGLTLKDFIDESTGRELTLEEIASRHKEAFKRAKIDA